MSSGTIVETKPNTKITRFDGIFFKGESHEISQHLFHNCCLYFQNLRIFFTKLVIGGCFNNTNAKLYNQQIIDKILHLIVHSWR